MRLLSPLWNIHSGNPEVWTEADEQSTAPLLRDPLMSAGYAYAGLLVRRPIPPHVTHARVRMWVVIGEASATPIVFRCCSANRPPVLNQISAGPATSFDYRFAEVSGDYGNGTFAIDFGTLPIVRGPQGMSYFWVSIENTDDDQDLEIAVHAWSGEPLILAPQSTGIPVDISTP
jgi:hypothetical protein